MILGDSLQVMASLAEREGLRGKVQCIYFDPPYGIKFNSNFQWSTTSRDVKDGNADHITREPEQVKAFRDTWRDGIHSYLTYLRDRLTVARDLLTDSGSIFVQIGDENVHRVRALMDEVFGDDNFVALITFKKTAGSDSELSARTSSTTSFGMRKNKRAHEVSPASIDKAARRRWRDAIHAGSDCQTDIGATDLTAEELADRRTARRAARLFRLDNLDRVRSRATRCFSSSSRASIHAWRKGDWKTTRDGHGPACQG